MAKASEPAAAFVEHALVGACHRLLVRAVIVERHLRQARLQLFNLVLDLVDLAGSRVEGACMRGSPVLAVVFSIKLAEPHDKFMKAESMDFHDGTVCGARCETAGADASADPSAADVSRWPVGRHLQPLSIC